MKYYLPLSLVLGLSLSARGAEPVATAQALTPSAAVSPTALPTAVPLYVNYVPPDWAKGWEHVTLAQAQKLHKNPKNLFLDARAKVEYDQWHIQGALPFPAGETERYYALYEPQIKKARKLVTYCHGIGCRLSEKAAQVLVGKGYKNVAVFFGGEPQWRDAKLPFETGDPKGVSVTSASNAQPASPSAK